MPENSDTNSWSDKLKDLWNSQKLQELLKDKRVLGAAAAGLAGSTAGALIAPDLIYKKPTWSNRLGLGLGTGLSSAAIVLAVMSAM